MFKTMLKLKTEIDMDGVVVRYKNFVLAAEFVASPADECWRVTVWQPSPGAAVALLAVGRVGGSSSRHTAAPLSTQASAMGDSEGRISPGAYRW